MNVIGLGAMVITPLARAFMGWSKQATDPNSPGGADVTKIEWGLLVQTIVRVGLIQTFLYMGLLAAGSENVELWSASIGFFADIVWSEVQKFRAVAATKA